MSSASIQIGNVDPHLVEWIRPDILRWNYYSRRHMVDLTSQCVFIEGVAYHFDPVSGVYWLGRDSGVGGYVVVTNANHERASAVTSAVSGFPVFSSERVKFDCADFPSEPVEGSSDFLSVWDIFPLEGGAPGENIYFYESGGIAVFGDCLINLPGRSFEILPDKYCKSQERLEEELKSWGDRTASRVRVALFAHGTPIVSGEGPGFEEYWPRLFDGECKRNP